MGDISAKGTDGGNHDGVTDLSDEDIWAVISLLFN